MSELSFPELDDAEMLTATRAETANEVIDTATISGDTVLVKYSRTEAALADLRQRYAGATFDLTTTKGDQAARAGRLELVTLRTGLEKQRKKFKAPAIEFGKLIDAEAARITAEIEALEQPIDAQIKADEARRAAERAEAARIEAARVAAHQERMNTIRAWLTACQAPGMTAERIANGIAKLERVTFGPDWQEFAVPAANLQCETLEAMRTLHAQTLSREQEAARQEAIAAENARVAAELAESRRQLEEQAAAVRRQQEELAAQRAESDRLEALAAANRQRLAAEQEAREVEQARQSALALERAHNAGLSSMLEAAASAVEATVQIQHAVTMPARPAQIIRAASHEPATLSLGVICGRLQFNVSGDFLRDVLHVSPAKTDKRAMLYTEAQFRTICSQLRSHVSAMAELYMGEPA